MGTSVEGYARSMLKSLFESQPADRYRQYYIDSEGYLIIGSTSCRISLTETTLTFLRYISSTEDEEFPFTKIA